MRRTVRSNRKARVDRPGGPAPTDFAISETANVRVTAVQSADQVPVGRVAPGGIRSQCGSRQAIHQRQEQPIRHSRSGTADQPQPISQREGMHTEHE